MIIDNFQIGLESAAGVNPDRHTAPAWMLPFRFFPERKEFNGCSWRQACRSPQGRAPR